MSEKCEASCRIGNFSNLQRLFAIEIYSLRYATPFESWKHNGLLREYEDFCSFLSKSRVHELKIQRLLVQGTAD
jgi:hypothetical protein